MTKLDVILGDVIEFAKLKSADGTNMKIQIVGVFDASDYEDSYWVKGPGDYYLEVFMNEKLKIECFAPLEIIICEGSYTKLLSFFSFSHTTFFKAGNPAAATYFV